MVKGNKHIIVNIISYIILAFVALCCIVPFMIVISASFSSEPSLIKFGYSILPKDFSLDAYKVVFYNSRSLVDAYKITIFTTAVGSVLSILIISLTAYPLARKEYKPRKAVSFYLYFTMLFSGGAIPSYILITQYLHLRNNVLVLIIPQLVNVWNIFVLRTYFASIPSALIEAAKIDGAGEFRIFFTIILPLSTPVLATMAVGTFLGKWNDWNTSLLYINDDDLISLQYLLQRILKNLEVLQNNSNNAYVSSMLSASETPTETVRMAMAIVVAGPTLVIFPFFQKYFVRGLTVGSVKG